MDTWFKQIKVFLGSPSDLTEERQRFRDIITEVNLFASLQGIQFDPLTSEDIPRDIGHPQELIDEKIFRDCEIFALLLWKRWGTPTKKYTSGFQEEYETAKALKEENHNIKICLYLRDIPTCMFEDPGPQLIQVLTFRTKVQNECLYGTYKNVDEWALLLKKDLANWLDQPRINKRIEQAMKEKDETNRQ